MPKKAQTVRVYQPGEWKDSAILEFIVERCHVGEDNRTVVCYFISRLKKGGWEQMSTLEHREIMREVIKAHRRNQRTYRDVMRGGF